MINKGLTDEIKSKALDSGDLKSTLNPPATENQIEKLKSVYSFPDDLYDLLRFSDGMELFKYDDIDGFNFYSVDKLINENKGLKSLYEEKWTEDILVFCEIIGEGNYIAINLLSGEILDGFHEMDPDTWTVISKNLNDFLTTLIRSNGEKFWLTEKE